MSDDDDGFVFGGDDDESLFGSTDSLGRGSERRFGTDDADSAAAGQSIFEESTATVAAVVAVAVLVVVAGAVVYPLVLDALDSGGATDGRAPSDGDSAGVSTPATPTEPPVTEIVMTVTESAAAPESGQATTSATARPERTASSSVEPTTERPTAPVEEFPAGEPADGTDTADGA